MNTTRCAANAGRSTMVRVVTDRVAPRLVEVIGQHPRIRVDAHGGSSVALDADRSLAAAAGGLWRAAR